jgi:hypothetical protein
MKNYFPLGSYSKPLARKIGLEASVLLFELIKDHGENEFVIDDKYIRNLGIETVGWCLEQLEKFQLLVKFDHFHKIDYDQLSTVIGDNKSINTKRMSTDCLNACKSWIAWLKNKKGINKDLGKFLNEINGKDEADIISAIQYSKDNGYKSLYFQDAKRVNVRGKINTGGDKTDSDKQRDYSNLVKKAGS